MENAGHTQLLRFKIENFRSFGREQKISFSNDGKNTRKITAIIGLNATGKSNILRALRTLQTMVKASANVDFVLPFDYFRFTSGYNEKPTGFELQFKSGDSIFSYVIKYNSETILFESLKEKRADSYRQRTIFERIHNDINPGAINFGFNRALMARTRPNTLLITKAIEDNNNYAIAVHSAVNSFRVLSCANGRLEGEAIVTLRRHPELMSKTIEVLKKADFTIQHIHLDEVMMPTELLDKLNIPDEAKAIVRTNPGLMASTEHVLKDDFNNPILRNGIKEYAELDIGEESIGTRALLGVIVPIIQSIKEKKILFIDEFGAYLHYGLVQRIIDSYIKDESAPGLIVCTHAGMILNYIDRDSIFVLEKNLKSEETNIHKLSESGARLDENLSNGYYSNSRYEFLKHSKEKLF